MVEEQHRFFNLVHIVFERTLVIFYLQGNDGFSVIAETARCLDSTKEINHASTRSQYFNENSFVKTVCV